MSVSALLFGILLGLLLAWAMRWRGVGAAPVSVDTASNVPVIASEKAKALRMPTSQLEHERTFERELDLAPDMGDGCEGLSFWDAGGVDEGPSL